MSDHENHTLNEANEMETVMQTDPNEEYVRALAEAEAAEETVVAGSEGEAVLLDNEVVYPEPIEKEQELPPGRSLPEAPPANVNLNVPFIHQLWDTPNWFNGHWACGPTSATMVLAYYGLLQRKPMNVSWPWAHTSDYGWYIANSFSAGGRTFNSSARTPDGSAKGIYGMAVRNAPGIGWCAVAYSGNNGMIPMMNTFLRQIGKKVRHSKASQQVAKASLDAGNPVIVSGRPFGLNGHLMVIRGYYYDRRGNDYGWIMNDPYGYRADGTRDYDGSNVVYWWNEIKPKYMYVIS